VRVAGADDPSLGAEFSAKLNFVSATRKIRYFVWCCSSQRLRLFFVNQFQVRLRDIGKAEEVLRASFRELNTNMSSWNREFFEGLRFACNPVCFLT